MREWWWLGTQIGTIFWPLSLNGTCSMQLQLHNDDWGSARKRIDFPTDYNYNDDQVSIGSCISRSLASKFLDVKVCALASTIRGDVNSKIVKLKPLGIVLHLSLDFPSSLACFSTEILPFRVLLWRMISISSIFLFAFHLSRSSSWFLFLASFLIFLIIAWILALGPQWWWKGVSGRWKNVALRPVISHQISRRHLSAFLWPSFMFNVFSFSAIISQILFNFKCFDWSILPVRFQIANPTHLTVDFTY